MTRLPVLNERPRTFELCLALGLSLHPSSDAIDADADGDESDEEAPTPDEERSAEEPTEGPCPFVGCADHLAWLAIEVADPRALNATQLAAALSRLEQVDLATLSITCARRGPYTLDQIGSVWGVSREWIRQIEAKALKKIRHPERSASLKPLLAEGHDVSRPDLYDREEDALAASRSATRHRPARNTSGSAPTTARAFGRSLTHDQWAAELGVEKSEIAEQARVSHQSFGRQVEQLVLARKRAASARSETEAPRDERLEEHELASAVDDADPSQPGEPDAVEEPAAPADAAATTEPEVESTRAADEQLAQPIEEPSAPEAPRAEPTLEQRRAAELFAAQSAYIHGLGPKPTPRSIANVDPQSQHAPALSPKTKPAKRQPKRAAKPRTAPARAQRRASTAQIVGDAAKAFAAIVRNVERKTRR